MEILILEWNESSRSWLCLLLGSPLTICSLLLVTFPSSDPFPHSHSTPIFKIQIFLQSVSIWQAGLLNRVLFFSFKVLNNLLSVNILPLKPHAVIRNDVETSFPLLVGKIVSHYLFKLKHILKQGK